MARRLDLIGVGLVVSCTLMPPVDGASGASIQSNLSKKVTRKFHSFWHNYHKMSAKRDNVSHSHINIYEKIFLRFAKKIGPIKLMTIQDFMFLIINNDI